MLLNGWMGLLVLVIFWGLLMTAAIWILSALFPGNAGRGGKTTGGDKDTTCQ